MMLSTDSILVQADVLVAHIYVPLTNVPLHKQLVCLCHPTFPFRSPSPNILIQTQQRFFSHFSIRDRVYGFNSESKERRIRRRNWSKRWGRSRSSLLFCFFFERALLLLFWFFRGLIIIIFLSFFVGFFLFIQIQIILLFLCLLFK